MLYTPQEFTDRQREQSTRMRGSFPPSQVSSIEFQVAQLQRQEQCNSLYGNLPSSLLLSIIIASILSASHWQHIGYDRVILWNLLLGCALLLRLICWYFWRYTGKAYRHEIWLWWFRLGTCLAALAWGSSAYFLFSVDSAMLQALLAFSIAGVASGSLTSLTLDRVSSVTFVLLTVFPLSIRLYLQEGTEAIYLFIMSLLFIAFVLTSSSRAQRNIAEQLRKNIELGRLANELHRKQHIEEIIRASQSIFIAERNSLASLRFILHQLLDLSQSAMGYIGRIDWDKPSQQQLVRALLFASEPHREQSPSRFQANHLPEQGEFRDLHHLFNTAITTGKPLISNIPEQDQRSGGAPTGHPSLNNFLAIPIYIEEQQVALLGLANKPGGYDEADIHLLAPLLNTIAQLVQAAANEEDHAKDKAALVEHSVSTRIIVENVGDGIIMINQHGLIQEFNRAAEIIFGYKKQQVLHKNISMLMPEPDKSRHDGYLQTYLKTHKSNIIGKGREVTGLRKNGATFPMDLLISMVAHDEEPLFIGIVRDNSEYHTFIARKNMRLLEVLTQQVYQWLLLTRAINHSYQANTIALPQALQDQLQQQEYQIHKALAKYFINEGNGQPANVNLIRKIRELIRQTNNLFAPRQLNLLSTEKREHIYINCDEKLLGLLILLLSNQLIQQQNSDIDISIHEEKNQAKITLSIETPQVNDQEATGTPSGSNDSRDLLALIGLYHGTLQKRQTIGFMNNQSCLCAIQLTFPLATFSLGSSP
ncbi:PAS domain S-box protein [Cellvibrio japonicus]|nr:PAS domain S-box protein [Cellvibrio japonicus]QEI16580.1 PAS domain S-box protein [Cellvibrio japonicus]QEI20158.1 PAS domain S-box protein [Cellvibrio japonicus]